MYKQENLRVITNTGKNAGSLYFYFNDDASTVTAPGFFKDVRLTVGAIVSVYDGTKITDYKITSKSGNDKTAVDIRDVATIKADLDDLGDQVQGLEAKNPTPPSTAGSYTLTCVVDSEGNATYSWV